MKEKIKAIGESIKNFFGKLGKKTMIALGVALGVLVILAIVLVISLNNKDYVVLLTGLSTAETSSVVTYLQDNGVTDYRMENNDTVLVPKGQENALKAQLLLAGYPKSGFFYDTYFDNVGSLSTESERNVAFLIALQEKIQAVIRSFDGVKDASVTIVQGEDRRYVLDDSNVVDATASVVVTLPGGAQLTDQQVQAIQNLVARSVKGLQIENVSITDSQGNLYLVDDEGSASSSASDLKLRLENQQSNKIRASVMQALVPFFGEENISVSVNCVVDVSKRTIESTTYQEPPWAADGSTNGRGIIGSRVYDYNIIRGDDQTVGGVAGTTTNSDIPTYMENQIQNGGDQEAVSASGQDDYLVDTTKEQRSNPAGVLTDVMVAVSINSTTAGVVNTNELETQVARAAGITDEESDGRISILSMPFYQADEGNLALPADFPPTWMIYAAIGGGVLFLLLLVLILILRRRKKKKGYQEEDMEGGVMYVPMEDLAPAGADVMNIQTEKSMELRKNIRDFADENPEIAAQMVKTWLKGGEENG